MLRALLKKHFLAFATPFTQGRGGKKRSKWAALGFAVLMLYAFVAMGSLFWMTSSTLCAPLVEQGQAWLYFAFMGVVATALGVVGGVFMAKSTLYEARDNDLLFSMPIPPWMILFVRMTGLYLFTLAFEACAWVPALVNYLLTVGFSLPVLLCGLVILLVLPLLAVAVCCLLGFAIAWLIARLPFKSLFATLLFLGFMVGYSLLMANVNAYLGALIANVGALGGVMETWLYPFFLLGRAGTGDALSLLGSVGIFVGVFALVYVLLSATYIRIVTMKKGEYRAKYKEKDTKSTSPQIAVLRKEFWRLLKSPAYLLNSSIGSMMMLIVAVMMGIFGDFFGVNADMVASVPELQKFIGLIVAVVVCFMAASNTISACSISLEGESLGLLRSMPVSEWAILKGKLYLHFLFTALPDMALGLAMGLVLRLEWYTIVGVVLTAVIASALFAAWGLLWNLKLPNLHWTNETAAVKQSFSVLIAMFGSWGITVLPLGVYFLVGAYLPAPLYLYLWLGVFAAAAVGLLVWLKKKGTEIFRSLTD